MQWVELWGIRYFNIITCMLKVISKEKMELNIYDLTLGQITKVQIWKKSNC